MGKKEVGMFWLALIISFAFYLILGVFVPVSGFLYTYSLVQMLWLSVLFLIPLVVMYVFVWYFINSHSDSRKGPYSVIAVPWADYMFIFVVSLIYLSLAGMGPAGESDAVAYDFIFNLKMSLGIAGYFSFPVGIFATVLLFVDIKKYLREFWALLFLLILELVGLVFYTSFF